MMIPEVRYENEIATLYVGGKQFFALSGEIHNSSSSSLAFMEKEVWPRLKRNAYELCDRAVILGDHGTGRGKV